MTIKILISFFVLFALSRAVLRYRDKSFGLFALLFWVFLWSGVLFFVWYPRASDLIASAVGVGRGVDVLIYFSVVALFYGIFRMYVKLEFIEHEITSLVRRLALEDKKRSNDRR
jgi:hypothetical protein